MRPISFKRHRFPPDVIRHAVWLYFRFTLSLRDIEELLADRGIDVTYETIRCWTIKFGTAIAANIRQGTVRSARQAELSTGIAARCRANLELCRPAHSADSIRRPM